MHILLIPSWYPKSQSDINGCFFREQAVALKKNGCTVGVIYPELRSLKKLEFNYFSKTRIVKEQDEGVITYRAKGVNWFPRNIIATSNLFVLQGLRLYKQYVAEHGTPDLIHVHTLLNAGLLAVEIKKTYGVPFLVTEHSTAYARGLLPQAALVIAKKVADKAVRRFAVSKEFSKLLNNKIGSIDSQWEEMPNIVSNRFTSFSLPKMFEHRNFKFINVGLMDEKKGQANILHAFSNLLKNDIKISLTLVGDGPLRGKLEQLSDKLRLTNIVKFTGLLSRDQVLKEMANADALILSSKYETFGVVVVEALALGKPVIATNCGGPESIVVKEDGILIPVDDIDALTKAIIEMMDNYNNYKCHDIRKRCESRFGEQVIVSKLKTVYADVLNARSKQGK